MGSDPTSRTIVLLAALALLGWAVWLVRDVLPPFLIAIGLALLLDPLLERMQRRGVPRFLAVSLTFLAFLALFFGVTMVLLPHAVRQISDLLQRQHDYARTIRETGDRWALENAELLRRLQLPGTIADLWARYQGDITRWLQSALQGLFSGLQDFANKLGWIFVVPIVTLYLMMDMEALRARLYHLIAERHREVVVRITVDVGRVFAAYLRGLMMICFSYGLVVYLALEVAWGLRYAMILALLAAVLYAVPYLGQIALVAVSVIVAWATGKNWGFAAGIAVSLVVIGQIFDQLITPRVMGRQVGLHPAIGLFALMVGAQLFGLFGMVIAVPVAASARVVLVHLFPRLAEPIPGFTKPPRKRGLRPKKEAPPPVAEAAPAAEES